MVFEKKSGVQDHFKISNLHALLDQWVCTMLLKNTKFHSEFLVNKGLRTVTNKRQ